jgi:hypothetical protein
MYHKICQNNTDLFCFFDETSFCLCQTDHYRVSCLGYDTKLDNCEKCLSRGKCIQGNLNEPNNFICLCPFCHQGQRCEFNMQAFSFTFDSLLITYSKKMKLVYVILIFALVTIGFFNNLCCFITFKRRACRVFGVGNYLMTVTCINQIVLLCLLLKFILITFELSHVIACKAISFSLSVSTRLTYWLTSWITVTRLFIILIPHSVALKNPRMAIGVSTVTSLVLLGMHVHEIIYYTSIKHLPTGLSICVTNFDVDLISNYNQISTLIHYIVPFFIHVIAVTLLIFRIACSRKKTIGSKMSFSEILNKQLGIHKEHYVIPIIIIFSALPQAVLTFRLACKELTEWQRHALLGAYTLSFTPQVLSFILLVLPSTNYKKEFGNTIIAKKYLKWMSNKKMNHTNMVQAET